MSLVSAVQDRSNWKSLACTEVMAKAAIAAIEAEAGWDKNSLYLECHNFLKNTLEQYAAKAKAEAEETQREAILCPGTPGRPPKYASVDERRQAIREQNRAAVTRFRAKQFGKALPSLPAELWQKFVSACEAQGLNPITEFTATLNRVLGLKPQSNVDFGREASNVDF
jgi:hypothetical protein